LRTGITKNLLVPLSPN